MFDDFIPSIKFVKYMDEVKSFEGREGRKITDSEAMDLIKTTQQIYGEMNERLYGRSSTVTSAMRLIFTAPGYGEGNFRTIFGAGREIGQKLTGKTSPTGLRNARFITSSMITSLTIATIGTRIMTGKWKEMPKNPDDFRDLFKIDTNMKDGNGDELFFDTLTYEKDYYSVFGNVASGIGFRKPEEITKIPGELGKRVSGAVNPAFKIAIDLGTIFSGGTVVDFRNRPVYRKSDTPVQKVSKLMDHELGVETPISLSTFMTSKEKGIDWLKAYGSAVVGIRTTTSELVKKTKEVRTDLYDMQDSTRDMQQDIDKLYNENPKKAVEKASKFNEQQAKKFEQYFGRVGIDLEFDKLPRSEQNKYLVTKGRQKGQATGTSIEGMAKRPIRRPRRQLGPETTQFLREQTE
jgi:hypothetical protein